MTHPRRQYATGEYDVHLPTTGASLGGPTYPRARPTDCHHRFGAWVRMRGRAMYIFRVSEVIQVKGFGRLGGFGLSRRFCLNFNIIFLFF